MTTDRINVENVPRATVDALPEQTSEIVGIGTERECSPDSPHPGQVIKHYELMRQLGAGGMGTVFLARDVRLGRLVAVKFLLAQSDTAEQRFRVEARITAQCRHENIVVIYDVGEINGYTYMVLEYIEGRTLREAMMDRSYDTPAMAVEVILPVVRALAQAHEMGIVHRDLKPENILLSHSGQVKVADFGIAKPVLMSVALSKPEMRTLYQQSILLTGEGELVGTLPYMAPEQWRGETLDGRVDVWAVGIILFELIAGAHPLDPVSMNKLAEFVEGDVPLPSIEEKCPHVGSLAEIINRCLRKNKDERFASATALAEQLSNWLSARGMGDSTINESPFAGLLPFQESDAARFFGRELDVATVIGRLRSQQIVMVTGPSGAGKSSLVRAGVIPAMKRSGRDVTSFVLRPGRQPLIALAEILATLDVRKPNLTATLPDAELQVENSTAHEWPSSLEKDADWESTAAILRTQPGYLGAQLRARCRMGDVGHRILIFVDQLEELFTLGIEPEERAAYLACLAGVADDVSSPLRLVVAMRGDFLDRLSEDRWFSTAVARGLFLLPSMTREGFRNALLRPLEAVGYQFEDDALAEEMLDGLDGTRCPLPILQFAAMKLWDARDQEKRILTRSAYLALGGVAGSLSTHADAVVSAMAVPEQRLARAIFMRLVTPERTRAIVHLDELAILSDNKSAIEAILHHLVDARLLTINDGSVELTHESLTQRWTTLRKWLDENEQDAQFLTEVRSAAAQWEKNAEADGFLWRDKAAQDAESWYLRRGASDLATREQRYVEAVIWLLKRSKRRQTQFFAAMFIAVCTTAIIVSMLAIRARAEAQRADEQKNRADEETKHAQEEARQARNATRMAATRDRLEKDPTTVLALLREIEPGSPPPGWAELAFWAKGARVADAVLLHDEAVVTAALSPDGQHVVTGALDKHVRIWNANGLGSPIVLKGHEAGVWSVAFSPDGQRVASAAYDSTVRIWNANGEGDPIVLRGHGDRVCAVAWSFDGQRVVSGSPDKTVRVWDVRGQEKPIVLAGHTDAVCGVSFSPDGSKIVSGSNDKTVRIWNLHKGGDPIVLEGHTDALRTTSFSPDGERVVSASQDKTVRIWNANGVGSARILQGHTDAVWAAHFSPDGERLATGSWDHTVRIWDVNNRMPPQIFDGHSDGVYSISWSADGKRVASASFDKTVRVWSVNGSGEQRVIEGHEDSAWSAAWSPDGTRIASASYDKTVRVWDADGKERAVFRGHDGVVFVTAWSPDGQRIASASMDKTVRIWDVNGQAKPIVLEGHNDLLCWVQFSPDGRQVLTVSADKTARIWSADGKGSPLIFSGHGDAVTLGLWSADGKRITTAAMDGNIYLWNADGKGEPIVLKGHEGGIFGLTYTPDGKHIVSSSTDKTVRIWNADGTGAPVVRAGFDTFPVIRSARAISPDGKRIVAAFYDGTVRLWNMDGTGEPIVLHAANRAVNWAEWSPDGKRIAAATEDKTIVIWNDTEPVANAHDPRLWTVTTYCMSLDTRRRLLGFSDAQLQRDLDECQRNVAEVQRPSR